jgi:DNA-binding beta-propeller fold protein YncE
VEGTACGRYRLLALLGRGGMGEVWRAFDSETNRGHHEIHYGAQVTLPFTGLNEPAGVAVDTSGAVYVADVGNNRVLKLPVS